MASSIEPIGTYLRVYDTEESISIISSRQNSLAREESISMYFEFFPPNRAILILSVILTHTAAAQPSATAAAQPSATICSLPAAAGGRDW